MIRTRIAPSPTGWLHIGTARTALFNYLFAKKQDGAFIIRIEDTDLERSDKKYEDEILESLAWLGIEADEGPREGGSYGPYRQSERLESYAPHLERLLAKGKAFRCPHNESELAAERKSLLVSGKKPAHQCSHRDGGGEQGIIRFKTPPGRTIAFRDLIRGEISFASDLLGDFSLAKDLGVPLYNFAAVVDDAEMAISHVIRGEDHIPNTPKQILIAEALGFALPAYAHLPLILGPDRSKLSKRHGATAIREFRERGYLPESLVNFMSLLGWNPGGDREIFSTDELVRHFDLDRVQKSGAVFNVEKLDWLNGSYLRAQSVAELVTLAQPFLPPDADPALAERILAVERPRLKKLSDLTVQNYFFREPDYPAELLRWKKMTNQEIASALERAQLMIRDLPETKLTPEHIERRVIEAIGGGDKGMILWPLRAALSGRHASPGPFDLIFVLGKAESERRIKSALEKIK